MKALIIPILQMVMAYHSGNAQDQYNGYRASVGQNTPILQSNTNQDTSIFRKTASGKNPRLIEQSLGTAAEQLEHAKTISDYAKYSQSFLTIATKQPGSWLALYYVAYCDARMALLTLKQNKQSIRDYCLNGLTYAKRATKLLNTLTDSAALSELYVVTSMLHWAGEQAEIATEGFVSTHYSYDYLAYARQLNNRNPRVLYWDAWIKLNHPKQPGDKLMGRSMAVTSASMFTSATSGQLPNWGKAENQELLNQQ